MSDKKHTPTIVQLVYMDETGDSYYRMRWPGYVLSLQKPEWRVINLDARSKDKIKYALEADLLVLFQSNDLDMHSIIRQRRENGLKTLVEYNDDFYSPSAASPIRDEWSSPLLWQTYESIMNQADNIIVTGYGLERLFSKRSKVPITILKNQVLKKYQEKAAERKDKQFRIGWAGSLGHMGDLLAMLPHLAEFCMRHDNCILHLMGNESIPNYVNLPPNKLVFKPWGTMNDYYSFLSQLDIGIAPLSSIPYNFSRSDIKAVEYASRGVVPLVQQILPYEEIISTGAALGFSSFSELLTKLEELHKSKELLNQSKEKAFNYASNLRNAEQITERLELYEKYLPKSPRGYLDDSFKPGYHEVIGELDSTMKSTEILNSLNKLLETDLDAALKLIEQNQDRLTFDNNFALICIKTLLKAKKSHADSVMKECIKTFPLDLRFYLYFAQTRVSRGDKLAAWSQILETLNRSSDSFKKFFEINVCNLLTKDIENFPDLLLIAFEIGKMFENNKLLFTIGSIGLANGDFHLAYESLTRLSRSVKVTSRKNIDFVDIPQNTLDTFIEAADFGRRML